MKKKIAAALAATFALGVTSAFAANPFSDVEAKHWAYDSVAKLAKAGIIDGYGDGTFRGDRTMTRYEMAQIVAKAMARSDKANAEQKAMINKLSAEFSAELDNLGVRVGALEKKVGTIKLTGDGRVRYQNTNEEGKATQPGNGFATRLRLFMNADINENTTFFGKIMAMEHTKMGVTGDPALGGDRLKVLDAAFTTKNMFGNKDISATVGRFSQFFLTTGNWGSTPGRTDGAKFVIGSGKLKTTLGYASFNTIKTPVTAKWIDKAWFMNANYDASKDFTFALMYLKEVDGYAANPADFNVWGAGFTYKFAKDFKLQSEYTVNKDNINTSGAKVNAKGITARLSYKGANAKKQGTWGTYVEYDKYEPGANVPVFSAFATAGELCDIKGWLIGGDYTLAKNVTLELAHQFNAKRITTGNSYKYSSAIVNFWF